MFSLAVHAQSQELFNGWRGLARERGRGNESIVSGFHGYRKHHSHSQERMFDKMWEDQTFYNRGPGSSRSILSDNILCCAIMITFTNLFFFKLIFRVGFVCQISRQIPFLKIEHSISILPKTNGLWNVLLTIQIV